MRLDQLIAALKAAEPGLELLRPDDREIAGIALDSRKIAPGDLFAALPGSRADGRAYIPQALAAGAGALLLPLDTPRADLPPRVPLLLSADPRRALAILAARFHAPQPQTIAAVTGTNGKTSVAEFTRQIWAAAGLPAASLGTLGLIGPAGRTPGSLTTPDTVTLHRLLADLARAGIAHAVLEASSHGLDQRRLDGLSLSAAAFTNLSRDHLDYHRTEAAYFRAKARLFDTLLPEGAAAVFNADVPEFAPLAAIARARGLALVDFGENAHVLRLVRTLPDAAGQTLTLALEGEETDLHLPLAGRFQAMNALAALGLALGSGVSREDALAALPRLSGVPGRMELCARRADGAAVYVDFAHTPDALDTVIRALRPHARGHLTVVFGCGGDRDRGKRPQMGAIVEALADRAIVTDDNPRTEAAAAIRAEILAGCPGAEEIGDRAAAIRTAMAAAAPGDVILVAGKGHETGQIVGTEVLPFSDRETVERLSQEVW